MSLKSTVSIYFILIAFFAFSQNNYSALTISPEHKTNSNAVIRSNITVVEIVSIDKINIKEHRIVTVLNKQGQAKVRGYVAYDDAITVKKLEAKIYDALGQEIKKIRKKDFIDISVADGFSVFNDNRAKYFDYTPKSYPYTVEFVSETERTNTAFIPSWHPIEGFYVSTEFSSFKIINNTEIELAKKQINIKEYQGISNISNFHYEAKNLKALSFEAYSPAFTSFTPNVKFSLTKFSMEGVKGTNSSWQNFGKWMNDRLINGTQTLPESVKQDMVARTKNASSKIEKAKIVYKFMQDRSRYVSIQVGIGGWKPMLAADVDRLGYGDCKGLTNYTKALLDAVGVTSYYTIVYGDKALRSLDKNFSSLEGNHVILTIPHNNNYIWLECTSQETPFGHNANFTDDRDALVITPDGGKIVHTNAYTALNSAQNTKATVIINGQGQMSATLNITYKGSQYDNHTHLENKNLKDQKLYYKNYYDNINNLKIEDIVIENDKDNIVFTERLKFKADKYATKAGNRLLVAPNLFNKRSYIPPRYDNRTLPFQIDRGYKDIDVYTITIANNFNFETLKESVDIVNKFGSYKVSIQKKDEKKITYHRELIIKKGKYSKNDYKNFRAFYEDIVKHDKSKIALKKTI